MSEISAADSFQSIDGVEINEVPDGYVIYDNDNERVHYLNTTAAIIFQMSDGNHSLAEISQFIKQAFDVEEEVDVVTSAGQMLEAGLLCKAG